MKFKTHIIAKAEILKPENEKYQAAASALKDKCGIELQSQIDLLYLRSCLVSAGARAGINDNDDIFTREEVWVARQTPILKPMNWQHNDKDILGVIYTVQARDLSGNVLDINSEEVPDVDFDLFTEAVIYRLIHPDRAQETEERAKANNLFVSMEAWFDDYGYGLCGDTGLLKVVARNENTSFLEKHLRASGGSGKYRDPDSNQEMRIGRVLRSITFGGCGLVDRPANKRSFIEEVKSMQSISRQDVDVELLLQKILDSESSPYKEELVMNAQANQGSKPETGIDVVKTAVAIALEEHEQTASKKREETAVRARAAAIESENISLKNKVDELTATLETKNAEVKALNDQTTSFNEAVKSLINEHVAAGATEDTPAEIVAIDNAKTGEAAFTAKLAWLQNSLATLRTRAARADELETQLMEAEKIVREQDVRSLLGDKVSDEALDTFISYASKLSNKDYSHWRDEKELMVLEITAAKKPPFPVKKGKKTTEQMDQEEDAAEASVNPFAALLQKRHSEGVANPDTMNGNPNEPDLINPPLGPGINSGVNPGALRNPRHKIAGSTAGNDPAKALENARAESGVQLAGASLSGEENAGVNGFRALATLVTDTKRNETKPKAEKPGFDPVQ